MNKLQAVVDYFQVEGSLSMVKVSVRDVFLSAIVIETPETAPYLKKGKKVEVLFKETEVVLAKELPVNISLENYLFCKVMKIEKGELLCRVYLSFQEREITSLITSSSLLSINLSEGDEVVAMVKVNELMLSYVESDTF